MNFGFESYIPYVIYLAFLVSFALSVFWRPIVGIFFLLPWIPLQTIRYRVNDLPLGESVIGITLLGVVLGLLRRGQPILPKTPWTNLLCAYGVFTFLSLCYGSLYLGQLSPFPTTARFGFWQQYMIMPALLLLTAAVAPTRGQIKAFVLIMCLAILILDHNFYNVVAGRDYSAYSDDFREGSSMGYAGSNGLAAFEAQVATFLLALAAFERKFLLRVGYRSLAAFSAVCVMYSFSRGGYLALLVGCLFLGLVRQRALLVLLLAFGFTWTSLVPPAVQQRVLMTYDKQSGSLDHSAETRLVLWEDAKELFLTSPVFGTGFNTYEYVHHIKASAGNYYEDTHNVFLKFLVETGVVGLLVFVWLLAKTFGTGLFLSQRANDPFLASLGLGLAAWVVCASVANCFGDRWTFLQVNGYMWVLGGLVSRALLLEESVPSLPVTDEPAQAPEDLNPQVAGVT
jgi:putative inorganic carbon (hco3(-)) transporter